MIDEETRRHLADLYREQDRLFSEHAEWTVQRQVPGASPVRKSQPDHGLLYRTIDDALQDAPHPEPALSDSEGYPPLDALLRSLGEAMSEYVHGKLVERDIKYDRKISELEGELREVKGMLSATLQLLGKSGEIVNLPSSRGPRGIA